MGTDRTVRSRPHGRSPTRALRWGFVVSRALSHSSHQMCRLPRSRGCPELALRGRPGRPRTVVTTCAMGDRHSSRRMDTTARGHGERVIALRQQRAAFGVQGCVGRWPCHTRARADAVGGTPHFFPALTAAWRRGSHPVPGTASVYIRTISGPAVLPKSRRALFALVSNALPLCHQQTKNPCTGRGSGYFFGLLPWRPGGRSRARPRYRCDDISGCRPAEPREPDQRQPMVRTPRQGRQYMIDVVFGVDVGTSSTKGVVVDPVGRILGEAVRSHMVDRPRPGHVEMDAHVWWDEFVARGRVALLRRRHRPRRRSQRHGPVHPSGR